MALSRSHSWGCRGPATGVGMAWPTQGRLSEESKARLRIPGFYCSWHSDLRRQGPHILNPGLGLQRPCTPS